MWGSGALPLFLQAEPVETETTTLALWLLGTASSGQTRSLDLFTLASSGDNQPTGCLPLFLATGPSDWTTRNMNLVVEGAWPTATATTTLVAWNAESGSTAGLTFFIQGSGITAGSLSYERTLPLYIERLPAGAISLFLAVEGNPASTGVQLFLPGHEMESGSFPLSLADVVGYAPTGLKFYTHGF